MFNNPERGDVKAGLRGDPQGSREGLLAGIKRGNPLKNRKGFRGKNRRGNWGNLCIWDLARKAKEGLRGITCGGLKGRETSDKKVSLERDCGGKRREVHVLPGGIKEEKEEENSEKLPVEGLSGEKGK